jgi:hypothetical protein
MTTEAPIAHNAITAANHVWVAQIGARPVPQEVNEANILLSRVASAIQAILMQAFPHANNAITLVLHALDRQVTVLHALQVAIGRS